MSEYQDALKQLASLRAERQSYESHWLDLQDFFLPRRGRWLSRGSDEKSRGNKQNQRLIDPTPRLAVRTASAGIHAGSTNPSSPFIKLTTADPELQEWPGVAEYLYVVESGMRAAFERSNVYSVLPTLYGDSIVFGTSTMLMLDDWRTTLHCVPSAIGSYYLATDSKGIVDTHVREYKQTAAQLFERYGDRCPQQVKTAVAKNDTQQYFDVLHVVKPRGNRNVQDYSASGMAWQSCYYMAEGETKVGESGFEDNPIAALRWETTEITDPYGSGPGMDVLGSAKAMQLQQKRKAQAIDKHVDPPMVGDPGLQNQESNLLPGGITFAGFTPNGSAPKLQPVYSIKPELGGIMADIEDIRRLVEAGMYTDLFLAITRADPRNASVAEIAARREEQILSLGPMLQNHKHGLIRPLVERTFNILMRQGRLPPPPPELEGQEIGIEMIGLLAQALRAVQGNNIERFMGYVTGVAQLDPSALDKVDIDQSIDEMSFSMGVPPTIVRNDDAVAALRKQRAEQQAQQQQLANAQAEAKALQGGAQAAKALSETEVGEGNALEALA